MKPFYTPFLRKLFVFLGIALSPLVSEATNKVGHVDGLNGYNLNGWVADLDNLNQSVNVYIFVNNVQIGQVSANQYRYDISVALGDNGNHGWSYTIPTELLGNGENVVYVFFDPTWPLGAQLTNSPKKFTVSGITPTSTTTIAPTSVTLTAGQSSSFGLPGHYHYWGQPQYYYYWGATYDVTGLPPGLVKDPYPNYYFNSIKGTPTQAGNYTVSYSITRRVTNGPNLMASPASTEVYTGIVNVTVLPSQNPAPTNPVGNIDGKRCTDINGWALDQAAKNTPIAVDIFVNNYLTATVTANQYRYDVGQAYGSNGYHGFNYTFNPALNASPSSQYVIDVKYKGTNTSLPGAPYTMSSCPNGRVASSFEGQTNETTWLAYPNPATDYIKVQIPTGVESTMLNVELVNETGQKQLASTRTEGSEMRIITSHLKAGIYILKIQDTKKVLHTQKILKF